MQAPQAPVNSISVINLRRRQEIWNFVCPDAFQGRVLYCVFEYRPPMDLESRIYL
jgi:hypothetical protein